MAEMITIARPYAKAVFALANEAQNFDVWSHDLELLTHVVQEEKVSAALTQPCASATSRQSLLLELVSKEISQSAQQLVVVLSENNRLLLLPMISQLYQELKLQMQKVVDTTIVSAKQLDDKQVNALVEMLKKHLNSDVSVTQEIDESLIGGVVIHAGDVMIDGSVKGKISKLAEAMNS